MVHGNGKTAAAAAKSMQFPRERGKTGVTMKDVNEKANNSGRRVHSEKTSRHNGETTRRQGEH